MHQVPDHKDIVGNDIADTLAKEAAREAMTTQELAQTQKYSSKEVILLMKDSSKAKSIYQL